jgi:hypothetical protein
MAFQKQNTLGDVPREFSMVSTLGGDKNLESISSLY